MSTITHWMTGQDGFSSPLARLDVPSTSGQPGIQVTSETSLLLWKLPEIGDVEVAITRPQEYAGQTVQQRLTPAKVGWLPDAERDLQELPEEAAEEGYESVSDVALANAHRLLEELAVRVVRKPMVHSTPEGGVGIDFQNEDRAARVVIVCEPDGAGVSFYDIGDKRGYQRSSDALDALELAGWKILEKADLL